MSTDAAILDRLAAIEEQNRLVLELLARLAGPCKRPADVGAKPYALARQLAREGKRAESIAETRRVSKALAEQEAAAKVADAAQ